MITKESLFELGFVCDTHDEDISIYTKRYIDPNEEYNDFDFKICYASDYTESLPNARSCWWIDVNDKSICVKTMEELKSVLLPLETIMKLNNCEW